MWAGAAVHSDPPKNDVDKLTKQTEPAQFARNGQEPARLMVQVVVAAVIWVVAVIVVVVGGVMGDLFWSVMTVASGVPCI